MKKNVQPQQQPETSWLDAKIMHPLFGRPETPEEKLQKVRTSLTTLEKELKKKLAYIKFEQEDAQREGRMASKKHDRLAVQCAAKTEISLGRQYRQLDGFLELTTSMVTQVDEVHVNATINSAVMDLSSIMSKMPALSNPAQLQRALKYFDYQKLSNQTSQDMIRDMMTLSGEDQEEDPEVVALVERRMNDASLEVLEKMPLPLGATVKPPNGNTKKKPSQDLTVNRIEKFLEKK